MNSTKPNIVDVSSSSVANTLSERKATRSQARLLASAGTSSTSKTTRAKKTFTKASAEKENNKYCTPSREKVNFINKEDSTSSSKRAFKTNNTPLKGGRNVIELSAISVVGGSTRTVGPGSTLKVHDTTPFKRGVTPSSSTSSVSGIASSTTHSNLRRAELERIRQEKLLLSEDKRKKAEEKKREMLDARAYRLKEERDARMEKIRGNKLAKELERHEANKKPVVVVNESGSAAVVTPVKLTARANVRRRAALEAAVLTSAQCSSTRARTRAATAGKTGNENAATAASKGAGRGSALKGGAKGKKMAAPVAAKGDKVSKKARPNVNENEPEVEAMEVDDGGHHQQQLPSASCLSPIEKVPSACQPEGINTRLDGTFTKDEVDSAAPQKIDTSVAAAMKYNSTQIATFLPNNTFVSEIANQGKMEPGKGVSTAKPKSKSGKVKEDGSGKVNGKANDKLNMAGKILKTPKSQISAGVSEYQMTPPPAPATVDNYDISRYIDSDDEEAQKAAEEASSGKKLPLWVSGRPFLKKLHKQFGQTDEQMAAQIARLFPRPMLPVPIEQMGLKVKERYVTRSSSINWKDAEKIPRP